MRAIILAAGRGSRLKSLTEDKPKCLIQLDKKPLLEWQLEALRGANITDIGIVVGYLSEKINYPELHYFKNEKWDETNMVYSLTCADEWLQNFTCIISYADIVYPSLTVEKLANNVTDEISIPYNTEWYKLWKKRFKDPLQDAETFKIDKEGYLLEIGNKAGNISDIQGQYMGLLKITPDGWRKIHHYLKNNQSVCNSLDITKLLNKLIEIGIKIKTIPINNSWYEIDTHSDIDLYSSMLMHG